MVALIEAGSPTANEMRLVLQRIFVAICLIAAAWFGSVGAQQQPVPKQSSPKGGAALDYSLAEMIVPVVHRISGWKLLMMLERNNLQALGRSASEFVHTNIVAGYKLADRRYIVVRLPQAEVEAVAGNMPFASDDSEAVSEHQPLTIIEGDKSERSARFIGLDATTGLSLLEIMSADERPLNACGSLDARVSRQRPEPQLAAMPVAQLPSIPLLTEADSRLSASRQTVGARVRLLAPVAVSGDARAAFPVVQIRMSEKSARLAATSAFAGDAVARIVARGEAASAERLPPALIGAVATDEAGAFLGIVDRVTSEEAHIIPKGEVEAAVRRVLVRRKSVPQPWLGAQGQALAGTKVEKLLASGWRAAEAQRLLENEQGILLTAVVPYTPAAFADLRPGDVVMRIGERPVRNVEDFSQQLAAAGGGATVQFTVARNEARQKQVTVQLSESFDPMRETERALRLAHLAEVGGSITSLLLPLGLEIVTAPAKLRARLGAEEGLLVVSLRKGGVAAASGLREGDIIERANGRLLTEADADSILTSASRTEVVFDIVRAGQRINITMKYPVKK